MYTILRIYFYFTYIGMKYCVPTSTNIYSYITGNYDIHNNIVNNSMREKIEEIFTNSIENIFVTEDSICALDVLKKRSLCKLVFEQQFYKDYGILLNKVVLNIVSLSCVEKKLSFEFHKILNETKLRKKMFHCPGRFKTVRTSIIEDDFYDIFYLSAGPEFNSISVYIHQYNETEDWFNIHDFIYNINVSNIPDMIFSTKAAVAELYLNLELVRRQYLYTIEKIFLKERDYLLKRDADPVCSLEYEKKISLCNMILTHNVYRNLFNLTLNKTATYIYSMDCELLTVQLRTIRSIKKSQFEVKMYPCYSRKFSERNDLFQINNMRNFYVSSGPRRNSVLVYIRETVVAPNLKLFHILELVENINLKHMINTSISVEELMDESPVSYIKIQEIIDNAKKERERIGSAASNRTVTYPLDLLKHEEAVASTVQHLLSKTIHKFKEIVQKSNEIKRSKESPKISTETKTETKDSDVQTPLWIELLKKQKEENKVFSGDQIREILDKMAEEKMSKKSKLSEILPTSDTPAHEHTDEITDDNAENHFNVSEDLRLGEQIFQRTEKSSKKFTNIVTSNKMIKEVNKLIANMETFVSKKKNVLNINQTTDEEDGDMKKHAKSKKKKKSKRKGKN